MADGLADDPRRPAATDLSTDPVADQMTSSDSICVAISNVLVAAGDGTPSTLTTRPARSKRKSSTSNAGPAL